MVTIRNKLCSNNITYVVIIRNNLYGNNMTNNIT